MIIRTFKRDVRHFNSLSDLSRVSSEITILSSQTIKLPGVTLVRNLTKLRHKTFRKKFFENLRLWQQTKNYFLSSVAANVVKIRPSWNSS